VPPQLTNPVWHVSWQFPPEHTRPAGHIVPHVPQFALSVITFVQNGVEPFGHIVVPPPHDVEQVPIEHTWPLPHFTPHPPQFAGSHFVSMQLDPHIVLSHAPPPLELAPLDEAPLELAPLLPPPSSAFNEEVSVDDEHPPATTVAANAATKPGPIQRLQCAR
jgi:hypothetical protein